MFRNLFIFSLCFSIWPLRGLAEPIQVAVSFSPQAYFIKQIAEDVVTVSTLIPNGSDHETYEPTISDLKSISNVSSYFIIGHPKLFYETELTKRLAERKSKVRIVNTSKQLKEIGEDPHLWLSPTNVLEMVEIILQELISLAPEHKLSFSENAAQLREEIRNLDSELKTVLSDFRGRAFLVYHPAWGVFAKDYGLSQLAIEAEGHEPGLNKLMNIIKQARSHNIKTIFVEPGYSKESATLIARELDGSIIVIDPLAENWLENMRDFSSELIKSFNQ